LLFLVLHRDSTPPETGSRLVTKADIGAGALAVTMIMVEEY
jgi:hypothetical protein